ncbi:MAG: dihydroorotase [Patescibacteria group bacterium]
MTKFEIYTQRIPDDFHVHFRRGRLLEQVVPYTVMQFRRALVMPNTDPPILTADDAEKYQREIMTIVRRSDYSFEPLMTIKLVDSTTPAVIAEAKKRGVVAGKLYPQGVTTGSRDGITDFESLFPVFDEMEKVGLCLSIHGEMPGSAPLDAERDFLPVVRRIAEAFPGLNMVLEHISTAEAVQTVLSLPDAVAGTITAHHLFLITDDVMNKDGAIIHPHNFCKPIANTPQDRFAICQAAFSGNPKFFFGSDSAPHPSQFKQGSDIRPGIFSAPVAMSLLMEIFEQVGGGELVKTYLENFTAVFGANFYGLPVNTGKKISMIKKPHEVIPESYGTIVPIVPFGAGQELRWHPHGRDN